MNILSERKHAAAQPRKHRKTASNERPRRSQLRKTEPAGGHNQHARATQNAQRNYERYLAMARAEALTGDRIAAENYFQHAEHYFRSMHQNSH
jgi:uncharacterized MAPEG superfamily protein